MRKLKLQELGRLYPSEYAAKPKLPITAVLDNLRSAMNVGSFFRTADALAVERIICTGITARPPHPEIHKTAIGADLTVDWSYDKSAISAIQKLIDDGYQIWLIEQTTESTPLRDVNLTIAQPIAVVFGNEVEGVSKELLAMTDQAIELSQYGTKHSLNVAVCGGIVLWHLATQMRLLI